MAEKPINRGHFGSSCIIKYKVNFSIGEGSTYNDYCWFNARFGINIGRNTLIGPYVIIQTSNHVIKHIGVEQNANCENSWCRGDSSRRVKGESIIIGDDVWIGARVTLLPGVNIPDKCVIGAGTLLTKSMSKELFKGDIVASKSEILYLGNRREYT